MRLDFLMLADGASVAEGKLYVHGGAITRVTPESLPSGPMMIAVVARILITEQDRGNTPVEAAIEWRNPDGAELFPPLRTLVSVELTEDDEARGGEDQGTIIVANALVMFQAAGLHTVALRLNGEVVVTRRLLVVQPA